MALHKAAVGSQLRIGTYWHMLPEYSQARKAIWNAVNPHTGRRRIDEAFPPELRASTQEHEMFIRFKNGSTWQVMGSDRYDSLVGTPPVGVVFSEWALANPAAWAYLAPILLENGGWAEFITTPRGRNHVKKMLDLAQGSPAWFSQVLTVEDTGALSKAALDETRAEYRSLYGEEDGDALFEQEYYCSFDAALIGSYYSRLIAEAERSGRVGSFDPVDGVAVNTAWDLGWTDDTVIWFYQVLPGQFRVVDYYASHGKDIAHYADLIHSKPYKYGRHFLPHDARPQTLAANGRTIVEQLFALGVKPHKVPETSLQNGIQAARMILPQCVFDNRCALGLEALRMYQREWDDDRKAFRDKPRHDWASHPADAFRYMALSAREDMPATPEKPKGKTLQTMSLNDLWDATRPERRRI